MVNCFGLNLNAALPPALFWSSPVGLTLDLFRATYLGSIGNMFIYQRDPSFSPILLSNYTVHDALETFYTLSTLLISCSLSSQVTCVGALLESNSLLSGM